MRDIKTYSRKYFTLKINSFYYNPITLFRSCCIPHEDFITLNIDKFNYEFEKRHGLLSTAESNEDYSYS